MQILLIIILSNIYTVFVVYNVMDFYAKKQYFKGYKEGVDFVYEEFTKYIKKFLLNK